MKSIYVNTKGKLTKIKNPLNLNYLKDILNINSGEDTNIYNDDNIEDRSRKFRINILKNDIFILENRKIKYHIKGIEKNKGGEIFINTLKQKNILTNDIHDGTGKCLDDLDYFVVDDTGCIQHWICRFNLESHCGDLIDLLININYQ